QATGRTEVDRKIQEIKLVLVIATECRGRDEAITAEHRLQVTVDFCVVMQNTRAPAASAVIVGDQLQQGRAVPVCARIDLRRQRCRIGCATILQASSQQYSRMRAGRRGNAGALPAFIGAPPRGLQAEAKAVGCDIGGIRRLCRNDAADRGTAIEGRGRPVQDLDALDEAGVEKLPGGVREVADVELVAQGYAVDEQGNPVAADTANVQAFVTETLPGSFGF